MARPSEHELAIALRMAASMRERGSDRYYLAKTLLNHHYQLGKLEKVLEASKRYLHSGEGSTEHELLLRAIREAEDAASPPGEQPPLEDRPVCI